MSSTALYVSVHSDSHLNVVSYLLVVLSHIHDPLTNLKFYTPLQSELVGVPELPQLFLLNLLQLLEQEWWHGTYLGLPVITLAESGGELAS